jgi:hypothetical protein
VYYYHYSTAEVVFMVLRASLNAAAPFLTIFIGLALAWGSLHWRPRSLPRD